MTTDFILRGSGASAIAAETGAIGGGQQENLVGIGTDQAGGHLMGFFSQRIAKLSLADMRFAQIGQHGPAQGAIGRFLGQQSQHVGRDT